MPGGCPALLDQINNAQQMLHVMLCKAVHDKAAKETTLTWMRAQYFMVNFRGCITSSQALWTEAMSYINS